MKEGTKNWLMRNKAFIFWQACHEAKNAFALGHFLVRKCGTLQWEELFESMLTPCLIQVEISLEPELFCRILEIKLLWQWSRHIQTPKTVLHAEILVVLSGIELCIEEIIQPISVFTYSLLTVRLIAGKDEVTYAILEDLQQVQMAGKQGGVTEVAHACRSAIVWKSDFPEWLSDIVKEDFA